MQLGAASPLHRHDYEEIILIEAGKNWVEMDKVRTTATPGQGVIIPANAAGKSTYLEGAPPTVT